MIHSPGLALLKRELLTALRSGRVYALVVLTLSISSAIVLLAIKVMSYSPGSMLSPTLLVLLTFCLYGAALLFLPPIAAVSICLEKQRDTWPLLQTSLVPPWQVVLAKILNVLVIYLLIVVATLPLIGVLFFFVGIDFSQYFHAMAVVTMTGVAAATWSVFCSAWFYRTLASITTAYIGVILFVTGLGWLMLAGLIGLFIGILEEFGYFSDPSTYYLYFGSGEFQDLLLMLLRFFCPAYDIVLGVPFIAGRSVVSTPWASCLYLALFSLVAYFGALRLVRRAPRPIRVDQRKLIDDTQVLEQRRRKFPYYLIDPQRRRKPIPDHRNPMFAKEVLASIVGRGTNVVRIAYCFAIPFFFYSLFLFISSDSYSFDGYLAVFQYIQGILLLLIAPALVANSVVKEYELGNMDMLRMTLLHPHQIVLGKLIGGASGLVAPALGMAIGSVLVGVAALRRGDVIALQWLYTNLSFAIALVLVLALTLRISIACRSLTTALVLSYLAALFVLLFLPWGLLMLFEALRLSLWFFFQWMTYIPSPPACMFVLIAERGRDELPSLFGNWGVTLVLSLVLFLAAVAHFRRSHMREK